MSKETDSGARRGKRKSLRLAQILLMLVAAFLLGAHVVKWDAVRVSARYRVTTVVPLVEKPIKNTYVFDQDTLDSFLEGYEEYAEFIVAVEKV
jgi:hypothetical protein